jgi:hypothetical protein
VTFLTFEAWPGLLGPASGSPDRRPGSVRRTTSIDMIPSGGMEGGLLLDGRGRDLRTATDGSATVIDEATVRAVTDGFLRTVTSIEVTPPLPGVEALVGTSVSAGFRKVLSEAIVLRSGSVRALLLDDLTGASIAVGSTLIRTRLEESGEAPAPMPMAQPGRPSPCIGHVEGGVMDTRGREGRPLLGQGPKAPVLTRDDDPLAWHDEPALPLLAMRRRRRVDVWREGGTIFVDAHFRDSRMEADGEESAVHEYGLVAELDADLTVVRVEAIPRSLPGPDCSGAAASAQRVVGTHAGAIRDLARSALRGDTTCTHLNDQLRSLADLPALVDALDA